MAAEDNPATALIEAYLELWQRNLIAFASEASPAALVALAEAENTGSAPDDDNAAVSETAADIGDERS